MPSQIIQQLGMRHDNARAECFRANLGHVIWIRTESDNSDTGTRQIGDYPICTWDRDIDDTQYEFVC
jgi:hypothetical protein